MCVQVCSGSVSLSHPHSPCPLLPQAKSTAEYIQASKARIAHYEREVRLGCAQGTFSGPHPGTPLAPLGVLCSFLLTPDL